MEISPKFTLSSNSKPPLKSIARTVGPGVFQKECSCCSSLSGVGGGDVSFDDWNREEPYFGNGAFFAARAAFYIPGQIPVNGPQPRTYPLTQLRYLSLQVFNLIFLLLNQLLWLLHRLT